MKFGELVNSENHKLDIFQDGFVSANIELTFLEEIGTLYTVNAYKLLDDYIHDLIDDETISPFLINRSLVGVVSYDNLMSIVQTIEMKYGYKWNRLWRDYYNPDTQNWINTYNPAENYDRHETISDTNSTEGLSADNEIVRSRYAFNNSASGAVPRDMETSKNKQSGTYTRTAHTHGNIGVTTVYQMLEGDRNLWMWEFLDVVIADLQKLMTIGVYDCEVMI